MAVTRLACIKCIHPTTVHLLLSLALFAGLVVLLCKLSDTKPSILAAVAVASTNLQITGAIVSIKLEWLEPVEIAGTWLGDLGGLGMVEWVLSTQCYLDATNTNVMYVTG